MVGPGVNLASYETVFDALLTTNVQENAFVSGNAFSYEDYLTYSTDEVKNFIFDPTAFTGENLVVTPPQFSSTGGPITVEYFAGATADNDGTLLGVSNRRGTSLKPNQAILRLNPSNISAGSKFSGRLIPANSQNPANAIGNSGGSFLPFELDCRVKYLIRITNTDGDGILVQTDFTWLEI